MDDHHLEISTVTDTRGYLEKQRDRFRDARGHEPTTADLANELVRLTPQQRRNEMDDLNRDIANKGELSLNDAAKLWEKKQAFSNVNRVLTKVGR